MEKTMQASLFGALVLDKLLSQTLYLQELEVNIGFWRQGRRRDQDDFLLAVTEQDGEVAMLLIDKKGRLYSNEHGRRELRHRWKAPGVYAHNMWLFIPQMAQQLHSGEIFVMGVKVPPPPPRLPKLMR